MTAGPRPAPQVAHLDPPARVADTLTGMGLLLGRPVLACVGGAGGMSTEVLRSTGGVLELVLRLLDEFGGAVVDGGTDAGVMRLAGQARARTGVQVPLVGVAAAGTVRLAPDEPDGGERAALQPDHTHVVLVPGSTWGDESPWLSAVTAALADGHPTATLVVNGGEITYRDIDHSLEAGRPVVVLAGTGRAADDIARSAAPRATRTARHPLTRVCHGSEDLVATVRALLDPAR